MMSRWLFFIGAVVASAGIGWCAQNTTPTHSEQQINDFSLAGYGEKGQKSWDISGKSADIFTDVVKLNDIIGNLYGKEENVRLAADRGDFNKADGKVHLEENVVITSSSGAKLTTDYLDWDRKAQLVSTAAAVNIERENMTAVGIGARGEPGLKKVALEKDVRLDIIPAAKDGQALSDSQKIVITCDGPLEIDYGKNIAFFYHNVKVEREDSQIVSDTMEVYFVTKSAPKENETPGFMGSSIEKIIARGNVKVTRGENVSFSEEAVYSAREKKITLSGRPKLIISSKSGDSENAPFGN